MNMIRRYIKSVFIRDSDDIDEMWTQNMKARLFVYKLFGTLCTPKLIILSKRSMSRGMFFGIFHDYRTLCAGCEMKATRCRMYFF